MYTDPTEPKDGDFAAYVERLTGGAGRTPGQVQRPVKAKAKTNAGADKRLATRTVGAGTTPGSVFDSAPAGTPARAATSSGPPSAGQQSSWGRSASEAGAQPPPSPAGGATPPDLDVAMRQLAGGLRSAAARLSQWLMIAGAVTLGLSLAGLWSLSLLPGIVLIIAAILLRHKSSKS